MQRSLGRLLVLCILALCGTAGSARALTRDSAHGAAASSVQLFVQPGAHLAPVLSLIRQARRSVRLEIYLLTDRTVITELGRAAHRGVDVRVLLEQHPYGSDRSAQRGYDLLQQAGVSVRWANEQAFRYTHEKAMAVDGRTAGIFTFNLTSSGIFYNREFGVIDTDSTDVRTLETVFDADWNRRTTRVSDPRMVVSPYNSRRDIQSLIEGARHTLDLYEEEVADTSMEAHLAAARKRGVRVRLITSQQSAGVDALRRSGVAVVVMPHPYVHAKAIVADGAGLFVGSENLSSTSLDDNREAGIVLSDRGLSSIVERTFAADWSSSGTPPGAAPPSSTSSRKLSVRVSAFPTAVRKGEPLAIRALTAAGATCSVRVTYPDGYVSRARSLAGSKTAGSSGSVTWSWHVGSTVTGTARADVTCGLNGVSASGGTTFEIQ